MDRITSWLEKRFAPLSLLVVWIALLVRLPLLGGSFWLDEAAQALESSRPWWQQLMLEKDFQPPLYHLVVHLLQYVSHNEAWLRLASLVPGLASIGLVMLIAKDRWGKLAALAAGSFLALSSFHVFFSQELRPYMMATFFATLAWLGFERWIWKPQREWRVWATTFVVGIVGGWYSSYVMLFWLPVFFVITVLWRRAHLKHFVAASIVSVVLYLPWIPSLREQLQVGSALRESLPGWEAVVSVPALKSIPLTFAKFLVGQQHIDFNLMQGLLLALPFGVAMIGVVQSMRTKKKRWEDLLALLFLAFLPIVLSWVFSFVTPVLAPKRIMYVLPVWAALAGWLVQKRIRWGVLFLGVWSMYQVVGLVRYWSDPLLQREDWRSVITHVEQRFTPDRTAVVMAFEGPFAPWEWYNTVPYDVVVTGIEPVKETEVVRATLQPILAKEQVLVFDYLRDLTDPYRLIDSTLQSAGYREIAALDGKQIGFLRVFTQNRLYAGRKL